MNSLRSQLAAMLPTRGGRLILFGLPALLILTAVLIGSPASPAPTGSTAVMDLDASPDADASPDLPDPLRPDPRDPAAGLPPGIAPEMAAAPGSIRDLFSWQRLSRAIVASILLWLITLALIATLQRKLVFPGQMVFRDVRLDVASTGWDPKRLRDVTYRTGDGLDLGGWLSLADPSTSELPAVVAGRPLAIYFGGNAGTRRMRLGSIDMLNEIGLNVLIVDYRSFAGNPGRPSEESFVADGIGLVERFQADWSIPDDQVVLVGESLGGAIATAVAAARCDAGHPPAALVLKATFASMTETAGFHYPFLPVSLMLIDRFPSDRRIGRVTCPLLQFHGSRDRVVPYEHGVRLFSLAPDRSASGIEKRLITLPQSGHNDMQYVAAADLERETQRFLREIGLLPVDEAEPAASETTD